jgi:hypothetical protein
MDIRELGSLKGQNSFCFWVEESRIRNNYHIGKLLLFGF